MRHHQSNFVGFFSRTWQASRLSTVTLLLSSLFLAACGGGSDDYSSTDNAADGAPSLSAVSIASGAKSTVTVGDVVTVTISASEAISAPTVTIGGSAATSVDGSGDSWTASRAMTADDTAGDISVSVAYEDISGDAGVSASATTDSSALMFEILLQTGFAIDGPFLNAKVFGDYNENGVHDAGEPSDITDENGAYSLIDTASAPAAYTIVVEMTADTVDAISGESYADTGVVLKGSSSGSVVTPLTTILEAAKVANPDYSAADLSLAMRLPVGVDITTYNPFAADADATTAHAVETVFQQVMTATLLVAEAMQGVGAIAGVELSASEASAAALTALTNMVVASSSEVNLADSDQVATLQTFAKSELAANSIEVADPVADFVLSKASATVTAVAAAFNTLTADDFAAGNTSAVSKVKQEAAAELAAMAAAAVTYLADNTDAADLSGFDTSATLTLDTESGVTDAVADNAGNTGGGNGSGSALSIEITEAFNGTTIGEGAVYTFPASAADYAGFANMNTSIYPITLAQGGTITFTGSVPSGASADVRFRFEANPWPATEPSFNTVAVTVSGADSATYSIAVPAQGANTFNSLIMYLNTRDVGVVITDITLSAPGGDTGGGDTGGTGTGGDNGGGDSSSAPTPTADAAGVLSIFSDAYTDLAGTNFNPNWGQAGTVATDNGVLTYSNLDYQGTNLGSVNGDVAQDVSGYESLHVDFYSADATTLKFFLVGAGGEVGYDLPVQANAWVSVDIPLTTFTTVDLTQVKQFKVDAGSNKGVTVLFDNLYFHGSTGGDTGGTDTGGDNGGGDSSSAPTPTADAAGVLSIFSDAYTDLAGTNFNPNWGQAGTVATDNGVLTYSNLDYQGTNLGSDNGDVAQDVSGYESLHVDFYSADATTLKFFLVGAGGEVGYDLPVQANAWVSVDIPLTTFTTVDLTQVKQFKVDAGSNKGVTVLFDNLYFHGSTGGDTGGTDTGGDNGGGDSSSAPTPTADAAGVLSIFSDAYTDLAGTNFNPNWGQAGTVATDNGVLTYSNLDYQGTNLGSVNGDVAQDVSGYESLHVDFYSADATTLKFFLVGAGGEVGYDLPVQANAWVSVDIPLTTFTTVDLTQVKQFKVDAGSNKGVTVLFDNLYFHGVGTAPVKKNVTFSVDMTGVALGDDVPTLQGTFNDWCGACSPMSDSDGDNIWTLTVPLFDGPYLYKYALGNWVSDETVPGNCDNTDGANRAVTVNADVTLAIDVYSGCSGDNDGGGDNGGGDVGSAPTPTADAAGVLSIFSDAYTDLAGTNFNPNWGQAGTVATDNGVLTYSNLDYQGTNLGSVNGDVAQDVSGYESLHVDFYSADATTLKFFLVGAGGEVGYDLPVQANAWVSVDIPLTTFTTVDLTQVKQFKVDAGSNKGVTVLFDNLYFHSGTSGSGGDTSTGGDSESETGSINFDDSLATYAFADIGPDKYPGSNSAIAQDPDDATNSVVMSTRVGNTTTYNGLWFTVSEDGASIDTYEFASGATVVSMRVRSPAAGKTVLLKFENADNREIATIATAQTKVADQWETLSFDFAADVDFDVSYGKIIVIYDFEGPVEQADQIFYFDDITYVSSTDSDTGSTDSDTGSSDTAPVPTADAAGVLSIFSDAYTDLAGTNFNPNWGQAGTVATDNGVLTYSNLDYQGTNLGSDNGDVAQDVSGYESLHVDFYSADATTLKFFLVGAGGEVGYDLPVQANAWVSVDIPLTTFTTVDLTQVKQFKVDAGSNKGVTVLFDNLYFHGSTGGDTGGTDTGGDNGGGDSSSAPTPTADAAGVLSIFSDAYTDLAGTNFNPNWGQAGTVATDNGVLTYSNLDYQGTNLGSDNGDVAQDVSGYESLHVDFYSADATTLKFFLVGAGGEVGYDLPVQANAWVSVDIPLTTFTTVDLTQVKQFKVDAGSNKGVTVLFDNLYFHGSTGGDTGGTDTGGGTGTVASGELITNGTFENNDLTGWTKDGAGSATAVDTEAKSGSSSAYLSANQMEFSLIKTDYLAAGRLTNGQSITASFDLKGIVTDGTDMFAQLYYKSADGVIENKIEMVNVTSDWKTLTVDFTDNTFDISGGISLTLMASCGAVAGCEIDVYIDNVSVIVE